MPLKLQLPVLAIMHTEYSALVSSLVGMKDHDVFFHIYHSQTPHWMQRIRKVFMSSVFGYSDNLRMSHVELDVEKMQSVPLMSATAANISTTLTWIGNRSWATKMSRHEISVQGMKFVSYGHDGGLARVLFDLVALSLKKESIDFLFDDLRSVHPKISRIVLGPHLGECLEHAEGNSVFERMNEIIDAVMIHLPRSNAVIAAALVLSQDFVDEDMEKIDPGGSVSTIAPIIECLGRVHSCPRVEVAQSFLLNSENGPAEPEAEFYINPDGLNHVELLGSVGLTKYRNMSDHGWDRRFNAMKLGFGLIKSQNFIERPQWQGEIIKSSEHKVRDHSLIALENLLSMNRQGTPGGGHLFYLGNGNTKFQSCFPVVKELVVHVKTEIEAGSFFYDTNPDQVSVVRHVKIDDYRFHFGRADNPFLLLDLVSLHKEDWFASDSGRSGLNLLGYLLPRSHDGFIFSKLPTYIMVHYDLVMDQGAVALLRMIGELSLYYDVVYFVDPGFLSTGSTLLLVLRSAKLSVSCYRVPCSEVLKYLEYYRLVAEVSLYMSVLKHNYPSSYFDMIGHYIGMVDMNVNANMTIDFRSVSNFRNISDSSSIYSAVDNHNYKLQARSYVGFTFSPKRYKKHLSQKGVSRLAIGSASALDNMRGLLNLVSRG